MNKKSFRKNLPRIITIVIDIVLFVAVFFLMKNVQSLLNSDVQINLTEIVNQNKDVITSKLKVEVNNLEMLSSRMEEKLGYYRDTDDNILVSAYKKIYEVEEDSRLFIADKDGIAHMYDGSEYEISGRVYFRLASDGIQNISDQLVSRIDGEAVFVISVPLYSKGEVVGTVQKIYTPEEMYMLCEISLFSSQGYMYIINSEGYILISSASTEQNYESNNYFRMIFSEGNREASQKIADDIQNKRSGFIETMKGGKRIFSAYTPIEEIHDWYLISSIATDAVSPNARIVIKMFYFILFVVILIFALIIFCFFQYKNRQQAKLEKIAFFDPVTQGNTYNKFIVDLGEILTRNQNKKHYILAFDIDNFKYVNNYYGFKFGDKVLYNINKTITEKLLPNERVARISGDHFVILLENIQEERLNDLLHNVWNDEDVMIYLSAGLYEITDPSESMNLMVDKASTAAQEAKGKYHKKVQVYSELFDRRLIRNELMKRSVEQALADDEIIPYFQPKVNINTGELVGAEALARWKKKDGELIPPGEFIPICENTGLVVEVDMVIFEKTLQFLQKNIAKNIKCVPISVNVSRFHLTDKDFMDKIDAKIKQYEVPSNLIELELTESVIFDNFDIIAEFTESVHSHGLSLSMDDFGSGYSSLNMLKDIPIDTLKIDRGFLKETLNSDRQYIILAAISKMAEELNIKVVVEGVETIENVNLMKNLGYMFAQGYYYARPMGEQEFEKIFEEERV